MTNKKLNNYNLTGECGIGYTTKDEEFYFDLEDYDKIKDYCWYIRKDGYICNRKIGLMHRLVVNCPENMQVDHINGNKTRNDNRKSNLRICTRAENLLNKNNKGYALDKRDGIYSSEIRINKKIIRIGRFDTEEEARFAYLEAKIKYHGEFVPSEMIEEYEEMKNSGMFIKKHKKINCKRVKCIETNKIYDKINDACIDLSLHSSNIIRSAKSGGKYYAGKINGVKLHWIYIEEI